LLGDELVVAVELSSRVGDLGVGGRGRLPGGTIFTVGAVASAGEGGTEVVVVVVLFGEGGGGA